MTPKGKCRAPLPLLDSVQQPSCSYHPANDSGQLAHICVIELFVPLQLSVYNANPTHVLPVKCPLTSIILYIHELPNMYKQLKQYCVTEFIVCM